MSGYGSLTLEASPPKVGFGPPTTVQGQTIGKEVSGKEVS